jgi:holo-[acyl-carrier protein] synthase
MIFGIGIDLVEVGRIRDSFARFGTRFQRRIFTESEIAFCETLSDKYLSYAARFAAKEAFSKALGTGLRGAISWCEIQVNDNERTRPTIVVTGRAAQFLDNRRVHVSLSHTGSHATAIVVIEAECSMQDIKRRAEIPQT